MAAQLILNLLLDGLMALLLIITTVYCYRLNRRIKVLQDSKSDLAQIIRQFDESTQRATQSISEIHSATSRIAENIQHKIDKANYIADDLQFMIEKGNKIADRMEGGFSSNRQSMKQTTNTSAAATPRRAVDLDDEQPAARATDMQRRTEARREPNEQPNRHDRAQARSSLESVLKKVSGRNAEAEEPAEQVDDPRRRRAGARLRSKAEQELFDALKAGGDRG